MKNAYNLLLAVLFLFSANTAFAQAPNYVPSDGLVGWWPFTGNANDASGNGLNGTVYGATLTTDRFNQSNSAYYFDGVNDYILVPHDTILSLDTSFTLSAWINIDNFPSTTGGILAKGAHDEGGIFEGVITDHNYFLAIPNNKTWANAIGLLAGYENSSADNIMAVLDYIDTTYLHTWTHMVGVRDHHTQTLKLYINGVMVDSIKASDDPNLNTLDLVFGRLYSEHNGELYNGAIDDVGIWSRALTDQEVTNLNTSTTSTRELDLKKSLNIHIYPNPTSGNLNISRENADLPAEIKVYSTTGALIYTSQWQANSTQSNINLGDLAPGLYQLRINQPNGVVTKRVIVNK